MSLFLNFKKRVFKSHTIYSKWPAGMVPGNFRKGALKNWKYYLRNQKQMPNIFWKKIEKKYILWVGGWSVPDILTGHQGWIISIPSDQSMVSSWNLSPYFCTVTVHMQNKVKYSVEVVISLKLWVPPGTSFWEFRTLHTKS